MKRKRKLLYGLCLLLLAGAGFTGFQLYKELMPRFLAEQLYEQVRNAALPQGAGPGGEVNQSVTARARPDFAVLNAWNPDIVGWIWGLGTDIDYPVVQGADNDYYLYRTADGARSVIGSIFMESKNQRDFSDDLTVLYGHHIRGGRMFSALSGFKKEVYYKEHPYMILYTPEQDYRVELFAGQVLNGRTGTFPLIFGEPEARTVWLEELLSSSTFRSPVTLAEGERILVLCTCSYEYQDARYAVYGVLRDLEEDDDQK